MQNSPRIYLLSLLLLLLFMAGSHVLLGSPFAGALVVFSGLGPGLFSAGIRFILRWWKARRAL